MAETSFGDADRHRAFLHLILSRVLRFYRHLAAQRVRYVPIRGYRFGPMTNNPGTSDFREVSLPSPVRFQRH